jgi:hypothetical protein
VLDGAPLILVELCEKLRHGPRRRESLGPLASTSSVRAATDASLAPIV